MIKAWKDAVTLADIGELMAQWIEGKINSNPDYCGDTVDEETYPLRKVLAKYNRSGFVTDCSQPGELYKGGGQRAFVTGFALEAAAKRIYTLSLYTDLTVLIFPPGEQGGYRLPVTVIDFRPNTWCGACWGDEELQHFDKELSIAGQMALRGAWHVTVIDPKWGRKSYLWKHVSQALTAKTGRFSVRPAPHGDFVY